MRFHRLDLIKYGKFSDRSVEFPVAKQDFHLIVGPNEAGKSTLRAAIVDLLFGIPPRSVHSFLHPLNELRLGAYIGNAAGTLEFQRAKAQKQTLRSPVDAILSDTALIPFLGTADRSFFDQMFGLDHTRLVSGGNSILNAENDVGQILFQSAAGVASLGKIRDALVAEADKLWAPRKSNERAYYIASDQLDKATTALKEATVRTKVWVDANSKVESLQDALSHERERHQQRQSQRNSLERIRRLAPFLMTLRENEQKLAELGEVIELPAEAAATLASAERELAIALERLALRNAEVENLTEALSHIEVDEAVLELAADISKLDNLRLQYSAYEGDIAHRKKEIAVLWQTVGQACAQLGWTQDTESAIAQRLPTLLIRRELRQLVRDRGGIFQTLRAAEQAEKTKDAEIKTLSAQLADLQMGEIKPALRAALANAKSLGDTEIALQKRQATLTKTKSALDGLLLDLGQWRKPLPELMALQPPSQEKLTRLMQERQALIADRKAELLRLKNQTAEVARIELQIAQFKALHHPTTREAVIEARTERDTAWEAIKTGDIDLKRGGHTFEEKMTHADQVADIDTMNADLKTFSIEANRLAQIVAAELKDQPAEQIALTLAHRLDRARESFAESTRLKEALRIANSQVLEAKESSQTATASLKPLMEKAGVDTTTLLNEAIGRSDAQRRLNAELAEAKATLLNGGDGLTRMQIEAEIDAANLVQLAAELAHINSEIADAVQQQTTLSADHANALRALSEIGGSDAATQAEAQRQEALAQMSDAAERYVKVFTAGRLLRWSIDRYREEKQGPLLQRAGTIFSTLTSGSFSKLIVDFEREPMVLEGLRSDGKLVGISGMSDGTRDQLYLALRLAALEMHLEQAMPLPFVADDLFINYDDVRSKAGFEALKALSEQTQVIFLSHHDHLIPTVQEVFGKQVNVVLL